MKTSIRDVAREAGVSVATVSKVLNGYPTVNEKTRERVLSIVRRTGFRPNAAARALVGQRSMTIGVLLTTGLSHPFFNHIMAGMEQSLRTCGYDLIYLAQLSYHSKEYNFVRHCQSRNVEGVVVFGYQYEDMKIDELVESNIPSIFIDLEVNGPRVGYIRSDHERGIAQAVGYLRSLGHERIAFLADMPESYVGRLRLQGYRQGMNEAGLSVSDELVAVSDYTREMGREAMRRVLSASQRPTAVVCCSDNGAVGAMDAIQEAGLSVPDDISVIGFDDLHFASHVRPALTTIRQNMEQIGKLSVETLDKMIQDKEYPAPVVIVPTELILRDSCVSPKRS
jgi:LacI family transcriptional regulator